MGHIVIAHAEWTKANNVSMALMQEVCLKRKIGEEEADRLAAGERNLLPRVQGGRKSGSQRLSASYPHRDDDEDIQVRSDVVDNGGIRRVSASASNKRYHNLKLARGLGATLNPARTGIETPDTDIAGASLEDADLKMEKEESQRASSRNFERIQSSGEFSASHGNFDVSGGNRGLVRAVDLSSSSDDVDDSAGDRRAGSRIRVEVQQDTEDEDGSVDEVWQSLYRP